MQKVFKNCYAMDKRCYDDYGLSEDILMEHAAQGMVQYINENFEDGTVLIVCGTGNNGADGIVLSRLLHFHFAHVKLYIPFGVKSSIAKLQLARVQTLDRIEIVDEICEADIIVDALFGAGLDRPLDEITQELIVELNELNGFKIACDIPTGIEEDGSISSEAFCADVTITMGARKELLYSDSAKDYIGRVHRIDLGVHYAQYTKDEPVASYLLRQEDLDLPNREFSSNTHKGSFGHVAIFCGEKEGAGIIAGMAASRFGAGLTTLVMQEKTVPPPYLMHATVVPENCTALVIGMGLGEHFDGAFLQRYVVDRHLPIVLDADSFYSADLLSILEQKGREIVITPHPKEFTVLWKTLTGEVLTVDDIQERRFEIVRAFNAKYPHITLLLKGANMLIVHEEKLYINSLGSSRLSKGGSGDVLSGLIVALLAQGYTAVDAAIQGSLALAIASNNYSGSSYAMISEDLIEQVARLETNSPKVL